MDKITKQIEDLQEFNNAEVREGVATHLNDSLETILIISRKMERMIGGNFAEKGSSADSGDRK